MPKSSQKEPESPIKTPHTRRKTALKRTKNLGGGKRENREVEVDNEFKLANNIKRVTEDPSLKNRRKTKQQVKKLEAELEANPQWTNEDMEKIAKKTGLSKSQVYKWNWDQKKKMNILPSKVYIVQLPNNMIDAKGGQIVLRGAEGLKKLQELNLGVNLETIVKNKK